MIGKIIFAGEGVFSMTPPGSMIAPRIAPAIFAEAGGNQRISRESDKRRLKEHQLDCGAPALELFEEEALFFEIDLVIDEAFVVESFEG